MWPEQESIKVRSNWGGMTRQSDPTISGSGQEWRQVLTVTLNLWVEDPQTRCEELEGSA
jgi:hypothetical protein